jgi:ABC-2 type transport system ATP-binding protein
VLVQIPAHRGVSVSAADPRVVADGVSKWFGALVAVSDVSFDVGAGVTALLGPNGAGKSTMFRMLCGLARPSKGTVRVLGRDPRADTGVTRMIGLVPQQESVFEPLTAREFVALSARLYGLPSPERAASVALEVVGLDPSDRRRLPAYSKGMRQRVKVAQAIVHDPAVLVLDEPLTGLDPRQRADLVALFRRLGSEGRCVIVSSHVLDEVERLGSQVLVMSQGRLAAAGDFRELRALMDDRPMRVRVRTDRPRELAGALLEGGTAVGVRLDGDQVLELDTRDARALAHALAPVARERQARLYEVNPLDADLEGVFRYVVQR